MTSSGKKVQTKPRQKVSRKTLRYCWALFEPARQSTYSLCRRKKPDTSTRTYTTFTSTSSGNPCKTNTRLYPTRNDNIICSLKHARWHRNRRLHDTTQTPRIYTIFTDYRRQNSFRFGSPSDSRQLWNPQTSKGSAMAQSSSSVSPAFYSNIQFLVKHGGMLVFRDYV